MQLSHKCLQSAHIQTAIRFLWRSCSTNKLKRKSKKKKKNRNKKRENHQAQRVRKESDDLKEVFQPVQAKAQKVWVRKKKKNSPSKFLQELTNKPNESRRKRKGYTKAFKLLKLKKNSPIISSKAMIPSKVKKVWTSWNRPHHLHANEILIKI